MQINFCPSCGAKVTPGSKFCSGCGAPFDSAKKEKAPSRKSPSRDIILLVGALAALIVAYMIFAPKPKKPQPVPQSQQQFEHPPITGMPQVSATDMEQIIASLPNHYDSLVQMGNHFMDTQVYPLAIECYGRAIKLNATDPNVITDLGACYFYMEKDDSAIMMFEKAIALNPRHPIAHFNMGIVYRGLNNLEKAREYWNKFVELDPQSPIADTVRRLINDLGDK